MLAAQAGEAANVIENARRPIYRLKWAICSARSAGRSAACKGRPLDAAPDRFRGWEKE
jgi:hypothetical protein